MSKAPPGEGETPKDLSNADSSQIMVPRAPAAPPAPGPAAAMVADPGFRRQVKQLYRRGPRLIAEPFAELAVEYGLGPTIDEKIARYLSIPDAALDIAGARQLAHLRHEVLR